MTVVVQPGAVLDPTAGVAAESRSGGPGLRVRTWLPPLVFGVVIVAAWQLICSAAAVPEYVLPTPSAIVTALGDNVDIVRSSAWVTARNAAGGLGIGVVAGLLAATVTVWFRPFDRVLSPLASAAAAIPIVASAPVFYGMYSATQEMPRLLTVAVVVFFPIYVSSARGLRNIAPVHADLMRSYAVSAWAVTRTVRVPGALGFVFTGLRIAAPNAVIAEIVAEYFGGLQNGIGYRITSAAAATSYPAAWSFVAASVVIGLVFFLVVVSLERLAHRLIPVPTGI